MNIACIGWGSLIWNLDGFPIRGDWEKDGPKLKVEFVRQSKDGRLTLVLSPNARPITTLWALIAKDNIHEAIESLKVREKISSHNNNFIGHVFNGSNETDELKKTIENWLKLKSLDAAIWTNLPCRFNNKKVEPSITAAVEYLKNLPDDIKKIAEEYVRRAPRQVDTEYRRIFESELNWKALIDNI